MHADGCRPSFSFCLLALFFNIFAEFGYSGLTNQGLGHGAADLHKSQLGRSTHPVPICLPALAHTAGLGADERKTLCAQRDAQLLRTPACANIQ